MVGVPGFLNLSLLALQESNAPQGVSRYTYKTHGAFEVDWSTPLPVAAVPLGFEGYGPYIASKGTNQCRGSTAGPAHNHAKRIADGGGLTGKGKKTRQVRIRDEYLRHKVWKP